MAGLMDFLQWQSEGDKAKVYESPKKAPLASGVNLKAGSGAWGAGASAVPYEAKGTLAGEGKLPESVSKAAREALEKSKGYPSKWMEGTSTNIGGGAVAKAGGLLKDGAKFLGKGTGAAGAAYEGGKELNKMFGMEAWDRAQNMAAEGQTRRDMEADPGLAERGQATAQGVSDNAMAGVRGLMEQGAERNAAQAQPQPPQAQPQAQPQAPQPQAAPQPTPEQMELQRAQQKRAEEAQRQTLERGVTQGLKTGQVSVSKLAEGLVQADAQRKGTTLAPEEAKKAQIAEIQTLKTMQPSDMAKYVSYALIAGGLLAAALDKSGKAGEAFSNSFNKQLDRNLVAGKMAAEQRQAALKNARDDRKVDLDEKLGGSLMEDRKHGQGIAESKLGIDEDKLQISRDNLGISQQNADTQSRSVDQSAANAAASNTLGYARIAAADARAEKKLKGAAAQGGQPLSQKESLSAVDTMAKARKMNMTDAVKADIASQVPAIMKARPGTSASQAFDYAVKKAQDRYKEKKTSWYQKGDKKVSLTTE